MGISFLVRDAQAVFLDAQEPTHVPGFENNKAKFRGMFIIPPDHPAVQEFMKATAELLGPKAEKDFKTFYKKDPTPQQKFNFALELFKNMENPAWGIIEPRADGKYADQEGMFFFKVTSSKLALYIPEPVPGEPSKTRYTRINNMGSEEWFYPGGIYSVKVDVNLFKQTSVIFTYFNGLYWRARGIPRSFAGSDEEEAPNMDDGIDVGEAPQVGNVGAGGHAADPSAYDDDIPF